MTTTLYKCQILPVVTADMVAWGCNAETSGDNISPADNSKLPPVDEPTIRNGEPDVTPRVEDKDTSGDATCEGMGGWRLGGGWKGVVKAGGNVCDVGRGFRLKASSVLMFLVNELLLFWK